MPEPLLAAIDPPPEELAIAALLQCLRDDPTLEEIGVAPDRVWAPEGDPNQLPKVVQWPKTPAQYPLIRLVEGNYPTRWAEEGRFKGAFTLIFELFYLGSHYKDRCRLVDAFRRALWPRDPARLALVRDRMGANPELINGELRLSASETTRLGEDLFASKFNAQVALNLFS